MEYATRFTGIAGQGIQLVAKTLALAATQEGREVTMSSEVGGEMRGGHSMATVVVADGPVRALPVVAQVAAVVALHDLKWADMEPRLRPGALVFVNQTLFPSSIPSHAERVDVRATEIATELGNPMGAGFVMLGAYNRVTGLVEPDALVAAMRDLIPPYRRQHLAANEVALRTGHERAPAIERLVWSARAGTMAAP